MDVSHALPIVFFRAQRSMKRGEELFSLLASMN
jgi:hypothetical protein